MDKVTDELGVSLADMTCVERLCEDATFNLNKLVRLVSLFLSQKSRDNLSLAFTYTYSGTNTESTIS